MANYDFTYTGAEIQAILDTAKKLKDSGYIFLGVATPSTNPGTPTQKVYYEAKQAGTYTNFGGAVLPDGLSLLIWNGSWTSETMMSGDGGVFDISVYKSTGGTLATFADLSAALNGGNNIPVGVRKGGMSVKFVQSSDNKYVQYHCTAREFTTDTTKWVICGEGSYIENPEFIAVWTDNENKIIVAIEKDGNILFGAGVPTQIVEYIKTAMQIDGEDIVEYLNNTYGKYIENPEFVGVITDKNGKILIAARKNADIYFGFGCPTQIQEYIENYIYSDGNSIIRYLDEIFGLYIEDSENRTEVLTDKEHKILSYRKKDGTKVEEKFQFNDIVLDKKGASALKRELDKLGIGSKIGCDWSDEEFVELPLPTTCAIINIEYPHQAEAKGMDIPTYMQFWDIHGNYFKKPVLLNAQGSSSMSWWIKNQAIDFNDGSSIKFGNWVPQDSFHIKKFYIDAFRGQCIVGYWLTEQMYQTKPYGERRPWDYLNNGATTTNAIGKFNKDFNTGALAHPDGFPVHLFFNGKDAGIYAFNMKKHRDNYYAKKSEPKNIILDGNLNAGTIFGGSVDWTAFEIRNPKSLKTVNGGKYDGDNPTEITGDPNVDAITANVKGYIERLSGAYDAITANKTKAEFEKYFLVPFFIDYYLVSQVLYNADGFAKNWIWCTWDGLKWTPTSYDMDSIFGMHWQGTYVIPAGEPQTPTEEYTNYLWDNTNRICKDRNLVPLLWELYEPEIKARYAELRNNGVFTTENIVRLLEKWVNWIGYDNLKNDIETVCAIDGVGQTPSYREDTTNTEYWEFLGHFGNSIVYPLYNETKADYAEGDKVTFNDYVYQAKSSMPAGTLPAAPYATKPLVAGFYNSILRVKKWLDEHISYLDSVNVFNYNN